MTSRVWKYLGSDNFGRFTVAYRLDAEPLCVDCERDLVAEITSVLAVSKTPPPAIYETARQYEGRLITWSICSVDDIMAVPTDLLPVLQAGSMVPPHYTRQ